MKVLSFCLTLIKLLNGTKLKNNIDEAVSVLIYEQVYFHLVAHDALSSGSWRRKCGTTSRKRLKFRFTEQHLLVVCDCSTRA